MIRGAFARSETLEAEPKAEAARRLGLVLGPVLSVAEGGRGARAGGARPGGGATAAATVAEAAEASESSESEASRLADTVWAGRGVGRRRRRTGLRE